jgi:uncharacterized protein YyaL (SSP411 family)
MDWLHRLDWQDWSDEAFRRARESGRPVFLFVRAAWCRWCRELETRVLGEERVRQILEQAFVPIQVDKDRRPDIDARYTRGGWPTLAYLDDAGEVLAVDNYMEVEPLLERLKLISDYYSQNRASIRAQLDAQRRGKEREGSERPRASLAGLRLPDRALGPEVIEEVARTVLETADPVHGGWGGQHKFPHPEAIDFALIRWSQTGDQRMLDLVRRTLRHMQEGEIHDRTEGGFYRYATQPDWSLPHHEKMLDSNAQRLFAYLEAYQALGEPGFRTTAEGILRWLTETLLDKETQGRWASCWSRSTTTARASTTTGTARRTCRGCSPTRPTCCSRW